MLNKFACKQCSAPFTHRKLDKLFCSSKCYHVSRQQPITKNCEQCFKEFTVPFRFREKRFCDNKCSAEHKSQQAFETNHVVEPCLNCGKDVDVILTSKNPLKYCSAECSYQHRFQRESKLIDWTCEGCSQVFQREFSKRKLRFCSKSCARFGDRNPAKRPEVAAKISKTRSENLASGVTLHPWIDRHHTDETKKLLSEICSDGRRAGESNGMFDRKHTVESKNKMSATKSQMIVDGTFSPYAGNTKKGWYHSTKTGRDHFFRSSWEEVLMKHLDESVDVQTWDYECIRLAYRYVDAQRWYIPDFLVTRVDGTKQLIEVKPREFIEAGKTKLKTAAAERWCNENNATFTIATRQLLRDWGIIC